MVINPSAAVGTASAVLALSKAAWKLGSSLSKLDQDTKIVDSTVKSLAEDVKSLSDSCDLLHTELDGVVKKSEIGAPSPYSIDATLWGCLATQVEETSQTIQELERWIKSTGEKKLDYIGQAQRWSNLDKSRDQIAKIRTKVRRHEKNLNITLLLLNIMFEFVASGRVDGGPVEQMEKLQDILEKLQLSSGSDPRSAISHIEATLMRYTRELIAKGTTLYVASSAEACVTRGQGPATSNIRVAEWVSTLESIRRDEQLSESSDTVSNIPSSCFSGDEAHTVGTSPVAAQRTLPEREVVDTVGDDSDDDLETDLAKVALDTGTKAFEAQDWKEADSFLQEALQVLQQLPKQQRAFCNIFDLQYKLAVCAYHIQQPADAEEALLSLIHQSTSSDEQRGYICDAVQLLSYLYIRMGQIDRARSECEKALQARRRLLGKRSNAASKSTALMAHISSLLHNRARAQSYLAMIPEARRDAVLRVVEKSLGTKMELPDASSPLMRSISENSELAENRT